MSSLTTRRTLLKLSGAMAAALTSSKLWAAEMASVGPLLADHAGAPVRLNLNENAFGPSATVAGALAQEMPLLARYGDASAAAALAQQIAVYEGVAADQVILGEVLGGLGLYLGSNGGPGGEFVYSTPGFLALIDAASHVGGVGVGVPLNDRFENDLPALAAKIGHKTRAVYLINPHNPTGTVSDGEAFQHFLRAASRDAPIIVDEAYLEYTPDFRKRSAAALVREGANVLVFRTFDKIHGLAGMPIGYTLASKMLAAALLREGFGDAESLGRLNMAAASAALKDTEHVRTVRDLVAAERTRWTEVLDGLGLQHTRSAANFIFFNAKRPHDVVAAAMRSEGIQVARAFPPYNTWIRITIGLPEQNRAAQDVVRRLFRDGPTSLLRVDGH